MSNTGNSIKYEAIREVAFGGITNTYATFGGVFTRDVFRIWITNTTNGDIYLSTDGTTNMLKIPAGSGRAYDNKTNDMYLKTGTQWYIKYAAAPSAVPASGWFALEVEYV
jgi:uncharacterized protein YycO